MQKITPFIWYEKDLNSIISYYQDIFPDFKTTSTSGLTDTPSGDVSMTSFFIYGYQFDIMVAGPYMPFRPTISFMLNCESEVEVENLYNKFIKEGRVLMPLQSYNFAESYSWVEDRYGISWQLFYSSKMQIKEKIIPTLMFCGDLCGRAKEAMDFYVSLFPNSKVDLIADYEAFNESVDDKRAVIKHASFTLSDLRFAVLDSGKISLLNFDQSISFVITCDSQEEIDSYWNAFLEKGGQELQCGWIKDQFGLPWQVVPKVMTEMFQKGTKEQVKRVQDSFMKMRKFDIKELERVFNDN